MDRGKRKGNLLGFSNNKIYMSLKDIIRENAIGFLPAKALMRCQVVCKDWKHQIASPFFAHNQTLCARAVGGLFCQTPGQPPLFISFDAESCGVPDPTLKFLPEPVAIKSSTNGLLCCQAKSGQKVYYVCNPATRQWKKIPKHSANHGANPVIAVVFEPSLLHFVADFKLVCAFPSNEFDDAIEFEIYSSAKDSWNVSGELCFKKGTPASAHVFNNVVYFTLSNGTVIAYDVGKDRSQYIYSSQGTFGEIEGRLVSGRANGGAIQFTSVYSHTANPDVYADLQRLSIYINVGSNSAKLVFLGGGKLVVLAQGKLHVHHIKEKETKEVINLGVDGGSSFLPYVNNLVSL